MTRKSHLPGNNDSNSGQTSQPLWGQSHSSTNSSAKEDAFWRNSHLPYPDKDKASQEGESTSPVCGLGSSKRQRQASQSQENSPDPGLIPDSQRLPPQAQQGQNLSHYLQHKGYIQGSESQIQRKNDEFVASQQQPSSVWVQRGLDLFRLHGEDFLSTLQGIRCTNLWLKAFSGLHFRPHSKPSVTQSRLENIWSTQSQKPFACPGSFYQLDKARLGRGLMQNTWWRQDSWQNGWNQDWCSCPMKMQMTHLSCMTILA